MKYTTAFLLFLFLLIFSSCPKDDNCEVDYHLEIPVEILPAQQNYSVGDTIFISSTYALDSMINLNTNDAVDASGLDFFMELLISKFDSIEVITGLDFIDYKSMAGVEIERLDLVGISALTLTPIIVDNKIQIKYYIIPQEKGNFLISFSASYYDRYREVELSNPLCDERLVICSKTNGGADNNYDFYSSTTVTSDTVSTFEGYNNFGGYSFTVEE